MFAIPPIEYEELAERRYKDCKCSTQPLPFNQQRSGILKDNGGTLYALYWIFIAINFAIINKPRIYITAKIQKEMSTELRKNTYSAHKETQKQ